MDLYFPIFKSFNEEIKMSELPSLGTFYPKDTKIFVLEKPTEQSVHNLLYVYKLPTSDTLSKAKVVLDAVRDMVLTKNIPVEGVVLCDLFYIYMRCCIRHFNLGFWHPAKKKWCLLKPEMFQFSRKLLMLPNFDTETKTYPVGEWRVSEPSVKNLMLAFDYLVWRRNIGKSATEKESKFLALIVYTCGNNNMTFDALESVLESFLERSQQEQEELIKTQMTLEDIGIRIVGIYDGQLFSLASAHPLPKYFN